MLQGQGGKIKASLSRAIIKPVCSHEKGKTIRMCDLPVVYYQFIPDTRQTERQMPFEKRKTLFCRRLQAKLNSNGSVQTERGWDWLISHTGSWKETRCTCFCCFSPTTSVRTGCISYQCALLSAVKARRADHVSFDHRVWDTLIKHTMNRGSCLTLNSYFLSLPRFTFPTFSDASSVNLCRFAIIMGPHHFYWALQEGFTAISATKYWQQFFWRGKTTSILALTNNPPSSVREQWIRD